MVWAVTVVLAACGGDGRVAGDPRQTAFADPPPLDSAMVAEGGRLYLAHCAECHRADLSGDPDWKTPLADGSYPPPPHDGSGHTWHHPDGVLVELITDPGAYGIETMPPFEGVLDPDEIAAILEFIKSHWGPDERAFQWARTLDDRSDG